MLIDKRPTSGNKADKRMNSPESTETGVKGILPGKASKKASRGLSGLPGGFLTFELPPDLESFFEALGRVCPICPNCRNLVESVRVDDLAGTIHCSQCDQLLIIPDIGIRWRLLTFMESSGLAAALDRLNEDTPPLSPPPDVGGDAGIAGNDE